VTLSSPALLSSRLAATTRDCTSTTNRPTKIGVPRLLTCLQCTNALPPTLSQQIHFRSPKSTLACIHLQCQPMLTERYSTRLCSNFHRSSATLFGSKQSEAIQRRHWKKTTRVYPRSSSPHTTFKNLLYSTSAAPSGARP
jgi:hypothetical protein